MNLLVALSFQISKGMHNRIHSAVVVTAPAGGRGLRLLAWSLDKRESCTEAH